MNKFHGFIFMLLLALTGKAFTTPLDDYVNEPDSHYNYTLITIQQEVGFKVYVINMTSQKWMDETYVKSPIWWHYVSLIVPEKLTRSNAGIVVIDGGENSDPIPDPKSDSNIVLLSALAIGTGSIVVDLKQIPNQPIYFLNDPEKRARVEDNAVGWTWRNFLQNPDDPKYARQLLYLPMTKGIVRAMDTAVDFASKNLQIKLEKFMVAGPSKRGWATWTTMAVDKRVFAAVPIVMDLLNLNTNLHNHFRSLGGWTFAFDPYHENNVTRYVDSFSMFAMQKILDPLTYLDRYKNIKTLAITSSGDEFFLIDETRSYWKDLVSVTGGSILLRRIPNSDHVLIGHKMSLMFSLRSFYLTAYDNKPLPRISWSMPNNRTHGIIEATVDLVQGPRPFDVKIYYAKTLDGKRKDFRLVVADPKDPSKKMAHPVIWEKNSNLQTRETATSITYKAAFLKPIGGWLGFFIQFSFASVDSSVILATTETNVIPETYPFDDCTLDSCFGKLV